MSNQFADQAEIGDDQRIAAHIPKQFGKCDKGRQLVIRIALGIEHQRHRTVVLVCDSNCLLKFGMAPKVSGWPSVRIQHPEFFDPGIRNESTIELPGPDTRQRLDLFHTRNRCDDFHIASPGTTSRLMSPRSTAVMTKPSISRECLQTMVLPS
ncbi:hypothetical protein FQZ97_1012530 [compost metagenome]